MAKQKVLVAEDDKVAQLLYRKGLPDETFDLKIVNNGEEALELFAEWQPDIVLLDYSMPILNGYLTLKTLRQSIEGKAATIIMVTSMADKDNIVACAKVGIDGYIVKPFKTGELATKIIGLHNAKKKQ